MPAVLGLVAELLMVRAETLVVDGAGVVNSSVVVVALLGLLLQASAVSLGSRWPCELACCIRLRPPDLSCAGLLIERWRERKISRGRLPVGVVLRLLLVAGSHGFPVRCSGLLVHCIGHIGVRITLGPLLDGVDVSSE